MTKSIQHKFFFSHQPELVWEYLTNTELIQQWLMPNDFLPILGYDFEFRTKPIPSLDLDGIFYCKVLEIIPYKTLTYSWKGGPGNRQIALDTIVSWTLNSKDNGTELLLEQTGFKEKENFSIYLAMTDGWIKNIEKIYRLINEAKHGTTNT